MLLLILTVPKSVLNKLTPISVSEVNSRLFHNPVYKLLSYNTFSVFELHLNRLMLLLFNVFLKGTDKAPFYLQLSNIGTGSCAFRLETLRGVRATRERREARPNGRSSPPPLARHFVVTATSYFIITVAGLFIP